VRNPAGGPEFPDVIALSEGAVATSGGYERFYDPDGRYHHIVSPWTGRSPRDLASVSVVAPDALTADALATALFVLGAEQGLRLIDRLPRCAALVLDPNGRPCPSRRWTALRARAQEGTPA
jgi:thiamine biosynthesis lipoprotein